MFKEVLEKLNNRNILIFITFLFIAGTVFSYQIFNLNYNNEVYFIDVGQGDSSLLNIGRTQIVIDGGPPNGKLMDELSDILPFHDRYIDLVVLTHPQLDHFGGLTELVKRYKVGLVLYTGRKSNSQAAVDFERYLNREEIKGLKLSKGDTINYKNLSASVLLPDSETINAEDLNDSSIVMLTKIKDISLLFTGDIGYEVESRIVDDVEGVDILKVPHHGSKYSSSKEFLESLKPKASFIQVGGNAYGHPTDEVLGRLENVGSKIFRTDQDGTIRLLLKDEDFKVFTKK